MDKRKLIDVVALFFIIMIITCLIPLSSKLVKAEEVTGETTAYAAQKYSDLDSVINDGSYTGITGTFIDPKQAIDAKKSNLCAVYKVVVPEDGKVYAKYWIKAAQEYNSTVLFTLYSDINLTNEVIKETYCDYTGITKNMFVSLKKGTYYLEVRTDRNLSYYEIDEKYGAYFGYVPYDEEFISFTLSKSEPTNKDVVVSINVNEDCKVMWMKPEIMESYYLDASNYWYTKDILEKKEIVFTKNSHMTVRIEDVYGNHFMKSISVTNIDKNAPGKPSLKTFKANTYTVTGAAEKGSVVYVVIGSKTYKTNANTNFGTYSVKTSKLKKGSIVKVYCKDRAGNKSVTNTVKAK